MIPTKNDAQGAYLTAAAAYTQLERDFPGEFEFIFVNDGLPEDGDAFAICESRTLTGGGSPQHSRHIGITEARGEVVFCLDSHVVCSNDWFIDAYAAMWDHDAGLVFNAIAFKQRQSLAFGYAVDWARTFWNAGYFSSRVCAVRYPIACAGHGAFAVRRSVYLELGGYNLDMKGWGGEETYLNLKFWMLNRTCQMLPEHYHWHFMAQARNRGTTQTLDFARNFCIAAYTLGGERQLFSTMDYFQHRHGEALRNMRPGILSAAYKDREAIKRGPYMGDLGKLREFFKKNHIPN